MFRRDSAAPTGMVFPGDFREARTVGCSRTLPFLPKHHVRPLPSRSEVTFYIKFLILTKNCLLRFFFLYPTKHHYQPDWHEPKLHNTLHAPCILKCVMNIVLKDSTAPALPYLRYSNVISINSNKLHRNKGPRWHRCIWPPQQLSPETVHLTYTLSTLACFLSFRT